MDKMKIVLTSFGHKYGVPQADIVLDMRCLENPFWVPELKALNGLEVPVQRYIFDDPRSADYIEKLSQLLRTHAALAAGRNTPCLHIAVGCTGGRHRSVAVTEFLARELGEYAPQVVHRDIEKG